MCCHDCWAYYLKISQGAQCRISQEGTNRQAKVLSDKIRVQYSPVYDKNILEIWPCEYRYTKKEIGQIRSGKLKEVYVTKGDAARVLEKVTEGMNIGYTWGF
jgi:hypothetical protein